jgi:hypothetical protein
LTMHQVRHPGNSPSPYGKLEDSCRLLGREQILPKLWARAARRFLERESVSGALADEVIDLFIWEALHIRPFYSLHS